MIPKYGDERFKCPHCQTVAIQNWFEADCASDVTNNLLYHLYLDYRRKVNDHKQQVIETFLDNVANDFKRAFISFVPSGFAVASCSACDGFSLWVEQQMKYPKPILPPPPNKDLDDDIKELYLEAASIIADSPKGSTAILRLALQKLLKQVGKSGKNINSDIKELVSEGLSPKIQQALDLLRVIGNNAVHPGQISIDDNAEVADKLFNILNFVADELITKPKELENLYSDLIPADTQEHIKQRDGM